MATVPDTLGPLLVTCDHCAQQIQLSIPVRMRTLDKGTRVEITIPDEYMGDVETAVSVHLRQHEG